MRNIPRNVGKFNVLNLDIYGIIFMIFPVVLSIILITKFIDKLLFIAIVNTFILTISYLTMAMFPNKERGIDIFIDFLKYQYYGDRKFGNQKIFKLDKKNGRYKL